MSSERVERAIKQAAQSRYTVDEVVAAMELAFGDLRQEFLAEIDALTAEIEALKEAKK
ncbi:hypothetical protein GHK50_29915 [Sinorhizobium medicae]|uniref:Uncharacterized protein n=1 Tax=Sinorhizobium medicae TaxID=110321 RepID=A0A6G1WDN6_9HYPH|nr:hypothetical protein [Sinorhizobium medicae]MQW67850.1 hypothetical protein [Sinorhizobium medicae]MQX87095.1 hypothetical protein [Sinorhizobium medicae]